MFANLFARPVSETSRQVLSTATLFAASILPFTFTNASAQNPIIDQSVTVHEDYDPFADHLTLHRHRQSVRASALDPNRGYVDPGSYRYVNRRVRDEYGRWVRETGYQWTSFGVPHGKLTRDRTDYYPNGPGYPSASVHNRSQIQYFSPPAPPSPLQSTDRQSSSVGYRQGRIVGPGQLIPNRNTLEYRTPASPPRSYSGNGGGPSTTIHGRNTNIYR